MKIHPNLLSVMASAGITLAAFGASEPVTDTTRPTRRGLDPELLAAPASFDFGSLGDEKPDFQAPSTAVETRFTATSFNGTDRLSSTGRPYRFIGEDSYWSKYTLNLSSKISLRPVDAARRMPNALGTGFPDQPGPALASGLEWHPTDKLQLGLDVMMRTERVSADYHSNSWGAYVVPAMEYSPSPNASTPISVGLAAPLGIGGDSTGGNPARSGLYVFVRMRW